MKTIPNCSNGRVSKTFLREGTPIPNLISKVDPKAARSQTFSFIALKSLASNNHLKKARRVPRGQFTKEKCCQIHHKIKLLDQTSNRNFDLGPCRRKGKI
jgi:hypothetical protein